MVESSNTRCDLMIFGAMGDLAHRKLFPALYHLDRAGLLHRDSRILAVARRQLNSKQVREALLDKLQQYVQPEEFDDQAAKALLQRVDYQVLDFFDAPGFQALKAWRHESANELILYMATPPGLYGEIARNLKAVDCCSRATRVVVEKPIGHDLASSQVINNELAEVFSEDQLFRIDHYLGKETIQNHLLQLLCLIAMDPPADLSPDSIRDEKVKVLKALKRITPDMMEHYVVRGQYSAGTSNGEVIPGYLEEEGANKGSETETFVALKAEIDNWRWAGVPFYIRTGKRLPEKLPQIIIHFKPAPHYIFDPDQKHIANNKLIIRLQPDEGMALKILTKDRGLDKGMRLRQGPLELSFSEAFEIGRIPDAYERLLWEVMKGHQYLFVRRDEVESAWRWVDQIIGNWQELV